MEHKIENRISLHRSTSWFYTFSISWFRSSADCGSVVKEQLCTKDSCPAALGEVALRSERSFNIPVTLSDHTGSIDGCRLNSPVADRVLGVSVSYQYSSNTK
jgi:hypothetical protein